MNPKRRLKCFVAIAVGKKDTDLLYAQYMRPAIKGVGMLPRRVDLITHNDRIDQRIRGEIEDADVLVADLTYARPSVYWEAGYGEREKPVVYTCRSDHLRQRDDDPAGNLAVHFDLRNANIITWTNQGSPTFERKLRRRLKFVTADATAAMLIEETVAERRRLFASQSPNERRGAIDKAAARALSIHKYKLAQLKDQDRHSAGYVGYYTDKSPLYWAKLPGTAILLSMRPCERSYTKHELSRLQDMPFLLSFDRTDAVRWSSLPEPLAAFSKNAIKRVRRIRIVPSLAAVPSTRAESAMPSWRSSSTVGWYYLPYQSAPSSLRPGDSVLPSSHEIVILDGIQSTEELQERLESVLRTIVNLPSHNVITPTPRAG